MPVSLFCTELLPSLSLLIPVVGLAARSKRKNGGEAADPLPVYQLLIDSYFDGVLTLNTEGIVTWSDKCFLDLMNCDLDDIEGRPLTALIDPGDTEKVQQYLIQAISQPQNFEVHAIDYSGSVLILELSMAASSENGEDVIFVGVQDISQEDALRKRIAFTEKMDLLSRVMGSINTDLEMILEALIPLGDMGSDPKIHETLRRLSELERRIELFPRRGIRDGADIAIGELLHAAVEDLRADNPETIEEIELQIADELYPIFGDRDQLTEAFRNVLRNSLQAAEETGGGVTVTCQPLAVDRATPRLGFLLPQGEYIHLDISDNGPGMPREVLEHVFEPLFSTRPSTPLAGLGLAVTYTIIKNHRGYIEIESAPSSGTSVEIYIPRSRIRQQFRRQSAVVKVPTRRTFVKPPPEEEDRAEAVAEEAPAAEAEERAPAIDADEVETPAAPEFEVESTEVGVEIPEVKPAVEPVSDEPEAVEEAGEVPDEPKAVKTGFEDDVLDDAEIASLSGHETVLIIEEDNDTRDLIQESLTSFGYSGLPARSWVEGLDLFKKHGHLVDLVLLNVLLPEMVWVKTLMDLLREAPEARVGLMGEDEASETMYRYLTMPGITYLIKPLTVAELMRGVRIALDAPKAG